MATWADLFHEDGPPLAIPKLVGIVNGDLSAFTLDAVTSWASVYEGSRHSRSVQDVATPSTAHIVLDPTEDVLEAIESRIRSGAEDAFFIVNVKSKITDYMKRKAQQSKMYFSVSSPSTDKARERMASFFMMRWSVTMETAFSTCFNMDFDPHQLYVFDKTYMLYTGGRVLPSSKSSVIVEELLGEGTANVVLSKLFRGMEVEGDYSPEFTYSICSKMLNLFVNALAIRQALQAGCVTMKDVAKHTGLTMYQVSLSYGLAEDYSSDTIKAKNKIIQAIMEHRADKEALRVLSKVM